MPDDSALLDEVDAARRAWDTRPTPPPLDGPCSRQLRRELAGLPDGVDPAVRTLAQQHREALDAAAAQPAPRPTPRPAPASPDELRRIADVLTAPAAATVDVPAADGPQLAGLTSDLEAAETRHRDTTAAAAAADQEAAAAADRYERMRAAAPIAGGRRSSKAAGRLKALALTILGVGVGLAALYFGLLAAFVFSAIVILPVVVSLLAAVVVAVRAMRRATGRRTGQPLVEDLVGAIVVVREKKAAAARAQEEARAAEQHLTECRAQRDAALRASGRTRRASRPSTGACGTVSGPTRRRCAPWPSGPDSSRCGTTRSGRGSRRRSPGPATSCGRRCASAGSSTRAHRWSSSPGTRHRPAVRAPGARSWSGPWRRAWLRRRPRRTWSPHAGTRSRSCARRQARPAWTRRSSRRRW